MLRLYYILIIILVIAGSGCKNRKETPVSRRDLKEIKESNELVAITLSGSISYFIYKGEPRGYEYEILKSFADSLGVDLKIKLAQNVTKLTEMLENGEGDIIAYHLPVTNEMKKEITYCGKESINEQVLVQRSNKGDTILNDVVDLIGKEVWVIEGSKHYQRLVHLNEELGGGITIKTIEKDSVTVEDLIGEVAAGIISYTFSDLDIARLSRTYYPNINIKLAVSHPQRSSWAVGKSSPKLAEAVNKWFDKNAGLPKFQAIMKRYFEMSKMPGDEPVQLLSGHHISQYDSLFKKYAVKIDWDWKLLASLAYQESRFDTSGTSWAGAAGLMGLMPRTAQNFGVDPDQMSNPEESLKAATGYIAYLNKMYKQVEDKDERIKFVLASYNAGPGHILDAQALAVKYEKNPYLWGNNVVEFLKLKQLPEYYTDSVCKLGYFRGAETINYVEHVVERWKFYQEKIDTGSKK